MQAGWFKGCDEQHVQYRIIDGTPWIRKDKAQSHFGCAPDSPDNDGLGGVRGRPEASMVAQAAEDGFER